MNPYRSIILRGREISEDLGKRIVAAFVWRKSSATHMHAGAIKIKL